MEKDLLRGKEAKKVTLVGFWVNALLTTFKIFSGVIGNSGAMIADGIHSLSDFLTDIVVLVGFKLTEKPEDTCHNYGHEKYETLATIIISIFLAVVGFEILKYGIINVVKSIKGEILLKPAPIALAAAGASILIKELLFQYTKTASKKINSPALKANAWHHRSDALSSIGTLIGIGGAIILGDRWAILDPIASIIVSVFIFKVAIEIFIPSINELMESSLTREEVRLIKNIITSNDHVKSYHKLRTRRIGTKIAIEVHLLLDDSIDLKTAHEVATKTENQIKTAFSNASIVTIHMEPFES
jgi:cation diffusion facilitator family transporter